MCNNSVFMIPGNWATAAYSSHMNTYGIAAIYTYQQVGIYVLISALRVIPKLWDTDTQSSCKSFTNACSPKAPESRSLW